MRKRYYDDTAFFYDIPRPENLSDWAYISEEDEVAHDHMKEQKEKKLEKKAIEKRKELEDAPVEKLAKKGQFYSSDYDKQALCSRKKEYKTGESASMGKIRGALKYTAEYTSEESLNNESVVSVEKALI
ncbi:hypothetical protein F8M41_017985 [Gigaspora margarita]|uniref:Uncharacterized protein n=1 Tax=Gigaspora margarita TaxID=4874 RepID=A0A8H4AME0_GIGMA|nr:hypothetical protein F8M41_017985 [Gigaspora margarita]